MQYFLLLQLLLLYLCIHTNYGFPLSKIQIGKKMDPSPHQLAVATMMMLYPRVLAFLVDNMDKWTAL